MYPNFFNCFLNLFALFSDLSTSLYPLHSLKGLPLNLSIRNIILSGPQLSDETDCCLILFTLNFDENISAQRIEVFIANYGRAGGHIVYAGQQGICLFLCK